MKPDALRSQRRAPTPVAVIGIGCWYPGAKDPRQLWENIVARRREFRRMPDERLPLADYHDGDRSVPDKTYGRQVAAIDGFEFDWAAMRIPKRTFESTDLVQWLALEVAMRAIGDAGYRREDVPRERTGVIVGNTLTGEHTRSNAMRTRWPYVAKVFRKVAKARGFSDDESSAFADAMEKVYKSVFAPVTEDTLAGGLSNTIAGRVCNHLDLHGGGYTVDGACSSSLLALSTACSRLASGDLDLALAGGVDISLDNFELIGFAKTGALSPDEMRVYDRRANGFKPGEGCGFVVVKRLEDAQRDQDRVYAVVDGWGVSSDGRGGITAPRREGQALALQRAYEMAGVSPHTLDFIEGHGTGTAVGDRTELEAIATALAAFGDAPARTCGVTSLKSIIGHTKAAAGIGAFIKASLAASRRVVPPTAGCEQPNAVFEGAAQTLYPIREGRVADPSAALRIGVSAMGFGGINCHVTLRSEGAPRPEVAPRVDERALLVSQQATELFAFTADSPLDLQRRLLELSGEAARISVAEMADLAAELSRRVDLSQPLRAAVVADSAESLAEALASVAREVASGAMTAAATKGAVLAQASRPAGRPRLGVLFPGQGAQQLAMGKVLVERFDWARELVHDADAWVFDAVGIRGLSQRWLLPLDRASASEQEAAKLALDATEVAQPAICLTSLLYLRFLQQLGLSPAVVGGHSLGELTAFSAAGVFGAETLIRLAAARGQAMAADAESAGAMLSLACDEATAESILRSVDGYVVIANLNSARQTVVSGERAAIEAAEVAAGRREVVSRRLPVSNAFHSNLVSSAANALRSLAFLPDAATTTASTTLLSCMDGGEVARDVRPRDHFAQQVLARVDFMALARAVAARSDLVLEVGPGRILSGLSRDVLGDTGGLVAPVASTSNRDVDLNVALGRAFLAGADVHLEGLYQSRLVRPFVSPSQRVFIDNPCERPLDDTPALDSAPQGSSFARVLSEMAGVDAEEISAYLETRGEFLGRIVQADLETLSPERRAAARVAPARASTERPSSSSAPPSSAPSSSPAPPSSAPASLLDLLTTRAAEWTGYPRETIGADSRLLDDLNLDSIKSAELVGGVAREAGVAEGFDPYPFANARLTDIVQAIEAAGGKAAGSSASAGPSLEDRLLELAANATGYPIESIDLGSRLLDDLNLDSIKAAQLVGTVAREAGVAGGLDPAQFANASLEDVARVLREAGAQLGASASAATAVDEPLRVLIEQIAEATGFAPPSIKPSALLHELGLDEDKLRGIIGGAARRLGGAANVDLPPLLDRSVEQVGGVLAALLAKGAAAAAPAGRAEWVRNFTVRYVEAARPEQSFARRRIEDEWSSANVLIMCEAASQDAADALAARVLELGGRVDVVDLDALSDLHAAAQERTHFICFLPPRADEGTPEERVRRAIRRLRAVALPPPAHAAPRRRTQVAFIQFGQGRFGTGIAPSGPEVASAAAFARSLHLERDDLRVRVLDLPASFSAERAAALIPEELTTPPAFAAVGFDEDGRRLEMRTELSAPASYRPLPDRLGAGDVVLVTGGAKGITAECVLELAHATGVTLALVGSSAGDKGAVLGTLERLRAEKISARYYSCDVTDAAAVKSLVGRVRAELGPIAAVIHGAGANRPRRVEHVSEDEALQEVGPKLLGAFALCEALADAPPRLFVALTSIIGVSGMPGNAWYAFANESLELLLRRFAAEHEETETLAIAFSVWSEVGMGARMGSVEHLARMGIGAIPPAEGTRRFVELMTRDPGAAQVVVTARLGGLDTWPTPAPPSLETHGFLERHHGGLPGVELRARTRLSLESDPFLHDHNYRGSYLFPTVFGLEAMAQAARALLGERFSAVRAISDIRLERPIVVDPDRGLEIEVNAIAAEPEGDDGVTIVHASLQTETTGFAVDHFRATFHIAASAELGALEIPDPVALDLVPQRDLYDRLLFQGPLFQRMGEITHLETDYAVFRSSALSDDEVERTGVGPTRSGRRVLGDPYLRDVMLQAAQLLVPQDLCLPVRIERIDLAERSAAGGGRYVHAYFIERGDKEDRADVVCTDEAGTVLERMTGYILRVLERAPTNPTAEEFADPSQYDARRARAQLEEAARVAELRLPSLALRYAPALGQAPIELRHREEEALLRELWAGDASALRLGWREDGAPFLVGNEQTGVSFSHDDRYLIAALDEGAQGIDIEAVTPRSREAWTDLLGPSLRPLLEELVGAGQLLDVAGTRVFAASEAARKKLGKSDVRLRVERRERDVVVFLAEHEGERTQVVTTTLKLSRGPDRVMALSCAPASVARGAAAQTSDLSASELASLGAIDPDSYRVNVAFDGPRGQAVQEVRTIVPFQDASSPTRTVPLGRYAEWMGKMRELTISRRAPELIAQMSTGEWGLVTNWAELELTGEANALDVVDMRIWTERMDGPVIDLGLEFLRVLPDGRRERLGRARQQFTWVRIVGHGVVEKAALPSYLLDYFERMVPAADGAPIARDIEEPLAALAQGASLLDAARPRPIAAQTFETTLEDSNVVGNIYYANYFKWQARVVEKLLYRTAPRALLDPRGGHPLVLRSRVNYLREAMPFDAIRVTLAPRRVCESGATLEIGYSRVADDGSLEKLAVGEQELRWVERRGAALSPAPLPRALLDALLSEPNGAAVAPLADAGLGGRASSIEAPSDAE